MSQEIKTLVKTARLKMMTIYNNPAEHCYGEGSLWHEPNTSGDGAW